MKREYLVVEDLYNKKGEIIYAENGIYAEDEEGNTIASDELKHPIPFVPIKTISEEDIFGMDRKKQVVFCNTDLYYKHGARAFTKGMIYTISEDGKTYYSNTESVPNPFQVISDIRDIRDAKESNPKDEYGGLFKLEFSWMVTPSSGGSNYLESETLLKAFDSGHECADYIESHIAKITRNPSVKNVRLTKIERI